MTNASVHPCETCQCRCVDRNGWGHVGMFLQSLCLAAHEKGRAPPGWWEGWRAPHNKKHSRMTSHYIAHAHLQAWPRACKRRGTCITAQCGRCCASRTIRSVVTEGEGGGEDKGCGDGVVVVVTFASPRQVVWCGVSLGEADRSSPVNSLRSRREELDQFARFEGFGPDSKLWAVARVTCCHTSTTSLEKYNTRRESLS